MRAIDFVLCAALLMAGTNSALAQSKQAIIIANASATHVEGTITGQEFSDYVVSARAGQILSVALESIDASINFNILVPNDGEALFIGSIYGPGFIGQVPEDGDYTIRVYQLGAAASEGLANNFTLDVSLDVARLPEPDNPPVQVSDYDATGTLPCTFEANPDAPQCAFGVERWGNGESSVFVTTPNGFVRRLDFAGAGNITVPGEADPVDIVVQGEDMVVNIDRGEEVYRITKAIVFGD